MNPFRPILPCLLVAAIGLSLIPHSSAVENAPPISAAELASKISALNQDGASYIRLRMEIKGPKPEVLQLQIKQRLTKGSSEIVYQVLFPKERKGESILLKKVGNRPASGSVFTPPATVRAIGDLKEPLFGSDLSYEDIVENFFAWDQQAIVGNEAVDGVNCQILESKPGKAGRSTYASVKSWIDPRRLVPLRIEKYSSSGQVLRRIDTTRVVADGDRHIPSDLLIHGARADSSTVVEGSRIKHDVTYTDGDFAPEGLKDIKPPHGSSE
jgi:hypothetical protein